MNQLSADSKKGFKNLLLAVILFFVLFTPLPVLSQAAQQETVSTAETTETTEAVPLSLSQAEIEKIEAFVQRQMAIWKIPGISLVIVKGDQTVYQKGFGFADLEKQEPVTATTLFELGSASKSFTGLAILQLEEKGLLKLTDPVDKYLPWFKMKFQGKEVPVTIGNMLYHTSGLLHYETLSTIPASSGDDALEKAVQKLVGKELMFPPGQKYGYTSIGYDVLGLIISKVSGQSYEEYMKKNIFLPLQMNNTYLFREEAKEKGMAVGYKYCFNKPAAYDAPMYRGNTPAGYVITNAVDLAQWLKVQMGTIEPGGLNKALIEKSHISNPDLPGSNYGAGWMIFSTYRMITHGGLNPNFSSLIAFGAEKLGVGVLVNMGAYTTTGIGNGIMMILRGMEPRSPRPGMNIHFDNMSMKIVYILSIFLLLNLVLLIISIIKIIKKKKSFSLSGTARIIGFIVATVLMGVFIYLISIIPSLLGFNVSLVWGFVWMPQSFALAILWIFLTFLLLYLFVLSIILFPKKKPHGMGDP
jgi:CubicO group peptidase (beta-lactamase class C family)